MRRAPVPEIDCVTATCTAAIRRVKTVPPHRAIMNTHSALLQRDAVRTVRELRRRRSELGETSDGKVLLVRVGLGEGLLRLFDGIEDVRLAVVVAVRADTEVLHDTRCRCHGRDVVQGIAEVNRAVGDGR